MNFVRHRILTLFALPAVLALALLAGPGTARAACPVTNTFVNGQIADANQVNTNLSELISCIQTLQSQVAALQALTQPATGEGLLILPTILGGETHRGGVGTNGISYYRFAPEVTGTQKITLVGADSDLSWDLYSNNDFTGLVHSCNNVSGSAGNEICTTSATLTAGNMYFLKVNELGGVTGGYVLSLVGLPDLSITITSASEMTGFVNYNGTITNNGDNDFSGILRIDFYSNPAGAPLPGDPADDTTFSSYFILAGGTYNFAGSCNSCSETSGTSYVIVDPFNDHVELDETNNVSSPFSWP